MAFSTYSDLTNNILSWLGRPGDTAVPVDDLVTLFEDDASTRLNTHFQELSSTITTVVGTDTYALPSDFQQTREVKITSTDPIKVLTYEPPGMMDDLYAFPTTSEPVVYTLESTNIRFAPTPEAIYTIKLSYYGRIAALASGVNWLYTNYPSIYLYGSLAEAMLFLGGDGSEFFYQTYIQKREDLYQKIIMDDRKYRSGGAPLQMRIDLRRR